MCTFEPRRSNAFLSKMSKYRARSLRSLLLFGAGDIPGNLHGRVSAKSPSAADELYRLCRRQGLTADRVVLLELAHLIWRPAVLPTSAATLGRPPKHEGRATLKPVLVRLPETMLGEIDAIAAARLDQPDRSTMIRDCWPSRTLRAGRARRKVADVR